MTMGADVDARAALEALIEAAAPEPLPADQALALLKRAETRDVEELGRLAYHALTGVDPGPGEPRPPAEALPGFPPFVAEVLNRAIVGPEERRPTRQALLIVLETVPAATWPTRRPAEPAPVEPASVEPAPVEPAPVEPEAVEPEAVEPETVAPVETEPGGRGAEDAFRTMVAPPRDVPRFEPLSGAGELPGLDRERRRRSGRRGRRRRRRSGPMGADRRQTLVMVAVILVLVALGALYAANRQPEEPVEGGVPAQGAPQHDATPGPG